MPELEISPVEQLLVEVERLRTQLHEVQADQRHLQDQLDRSTDRYRALFETNPCPMWIFDLATFGFLAVNDAAVDHYGYRREEFLAMTIDDVRPPETVEQVRDYILHRASEEHHYAGIWRHRKRDGKDIDVEIFSHLLEWEGRPARLVMARDVTERQRAEQALRVSEERYRLLVERNLAGVFRTTLEGQVLDCNEAFARINGYATRDEVLKVNAVNFYSHRKDRERLLDELRARGQVSNMELCCRRKDGSPVWLLENVTLVPGADGGPVLEGTIVDITPQKNTEAALRASEERFHAFMDHSPVVAYLKDEDGRYVYGSETWARQFHQPRAALLGKTDFDLWPPATARLFRQSDAETLAAGKNIERIEAGVTPEGEFRQWMTFKFPIHDAAGRQFIAGMALDITEHMRAENALRESEVRYRLLAENATDVISRHTPDGMYLYSSPACRALMGYAPEELAGRSIYDVVHPDDAAAVRRTLAEITAGAKGPPSAFRMRHKDGNYLWVEIAGRGVTAADGTVGEIVAVSRDITDRKRLEDQVIQAQKMEAVGRLAGGVAHDFNNLLTAILGFANLLLAGRPKDDPARPDLEQIKKAGERAATLTRQLLAFSRKQIMRLQVLDLNAIVRDMDKMLRRLIGEDVELVAALAANLRPITADPGQLEQVIMNLAVNARDAMPHGGKLTLVTANCLVPGTLGDAPPGVPPGEYASLTVRDSGCGMDKITQDRLFEPFFTTKGQGKGTGLGLATVYGIVKQCDGHICVTSDVGQGTTFAIYLPVSAKGPEPAALELPAPASMAGNETVLLAEDEDVLRTLVSVILRQNGYHVIEARDGADALEQARQFSGAIHLLVTDVVMPILNGRQLVERLVQLRPALKVLYISGYTDDAIVRHGILDPEVAFLPKPFNPASLVHKVREVLDREVRATGEGSAAVLAPVENGAK